MKYLIILILTTGMVACSEDEKKDKENKVPKRPCVNCPSSYTEQRGYDGRWYFEFKNGIVKCHGLVSGSYAQCWWRH